MCVCVCVCVCKNVFENSNVAMYILFMISFNDM